MTSRYTQQNAEVYYMSDARVIWDASDIMFLKQRAEENPRRRCRLCAHPDITAHQHEMLIIHGREAYVRPHRHIGRAESFQIIEGAATAIFFDSAGDIETAVQLSTPVNGGSFYYRVPENTYHTLIIESEWLVFYETTEGPFDPSSCAFPTWAPDGQDMEAASKYIRDLASKYGDVA